MKIDFPCTLLFLSISFAAFSQYNFHKTTSKNTPKKPFSKENKDSVLNALITDIKENHPLVLGIGHEIPVKFQTYSYLGHIINKDSGSMHRLITVQTFFQNDSSDSKILIFEQELYMGYYHLKKVRAKRIVNSQYLTFDQMVLDINDHPVPVHVNLSKGIPYRFKVKEEELVLTPCETFLNDPIQEEEQEKKLSQPPSLTGQK